MNEKQKTLLESVNGNYRLLLERSFQGTLTPRQAIKIKCLDCSDYDRDEVEHCQVTLCSLHQYRPYQKGVTRAGTGRLREVSAPVAHAEP